MAREVRRLAAEGYGLKAHPLVGVQPVSMMGGGVPNAENMTHGSQAYKVVSWVYMCVYAIANSGSMLPFIVEELKGDRWVSAGQSHPLLRLLERPSEDQWLTGQDLLEALYSDIELNGNAYLYKERDSTGQTQALYRLKPDNVEVVPGRDRADGMVKGYLYKVNGKALKYERAEVIHIRTFNPTSEFYGQGSLTAARLAATVDTQAQVRNKSLLTNDAVPGGFLVHDASLDEKAVSRIQKQWAKAHQGATKSGKIAVLHGGLGFKPAGIAPKELEYIEGRRFTRDEIAGCFRVPPAMVGNLDAANYSNMQEQKVQFWHDTMIPKETKVAAALTIALADEHTTRPGTLRVAFDLTGVHPLVKDQHEMAKVDRDLVQSMIVTINEVRERRNLGEPKPWGDVAWAPLNMVPISSPGDYGVGISARGGPSTNPPGFSPLTGGGPGGLPKGTRRLYDLGTERGLKAQDLRDRTWEVMLAPLRAQVRRAVTAILEDQLKETLSNLGKAIPRLLSDGHEKIASVDVESILYDYEYWRDGTVARMTPHYVNLMESGGIFAMAELGLGVDFDVTMPQVQEAIRTKAFRFAQDWNKTTLDALRVELDAAAVEGDSFKQVKARINDVFGGRKDNAEVVGVTESGATANQGSLMGYRQSGVVDYKEWHSGGPNPRAHHLTSGGVFVDSGLTAVVGVDDMWIVMGEQMEFPGDVRGKAENVCNCHCGILPVVNVEE
jgi:HK97 family phage portal protein